MERECFDFNEWVAGKREPIERSAILNAFSAYKRAARSCITLYSGLLEMSRVLRRGMGLLKARNMRFDSIRIKDSETAINVLGEWLGDMKIELADMGSYLVGLCDRADAVLSDHDKAQVLGISHLRMQAIIRSNSHREDGSDTGMFKLIFLHHAEHHGGKDFVVYGEDQMPLFQTAEKSVFRHIQATPELRKKSRELFESIMEEAGIPMYSIEVGPNMEKIVKRLPPKLEIVKPQ